MASKRRLRRQACGTKKRYDSAEDARRGIGRLIRAGRAGTVWLQSYKCPFCGGWHFGHNGVAR